MNVSATIGYYTSKVYRHSLMRVHEPALRQYPLRTSPQYRDAGSFLRIAALRTSKITAHGTYNILNAGTELYVDLENAQDATGVSIIVYTLDTQPFGNTNQQWQLATNGGGNLKTVQSVAYSDLYVTTTENSNGSGLVSGSSQTVSIEASAGSQYYIRVVDTELYWQATSSAAGTQITVGGLRTDGGDKWVFIPVISSS
ncbi:hypothetical protein AcV5_000060 [Taiwanofungus camphoratus]|nr:hypothetical protein AcV5_000060 [Antrodia cinnamomea]